MKYFVVLICLFVVGSTRQSPQFKPDLSEEWQHFKSVYKKSYGEEEEARRREIWEKKVSGISRHNLRADLGLHSYRIGLNKYSDRTYQEFLRLLHGFRIRPDASDRHNETYFRSTDNGIPDHVDWRNKGFVTPVKDQGDACGGCWAFSATGALEGQQKKKSGKLVALSEQNLVDCCKKNYGCDGGDIDTAFDCVKRLHGVDTEISYPYKEKEGVCHFNPRTVGATCSGYVHIPMGNEEALKHAVASIGPISVAIDAHHESFHDYKVGIFDEPDCKNDLTDLTHALLLIGYGTEDGKDYWILKNRVNKINVSEQLLSDNVWYGYHPDDSNGDKSHGTSGWAMFSFWGESFGHNGYIKMSRNKNNQCGIATKASYPIL